MVGWQPRALLTEQNINHEISYRVKPSINGVRSGLADAAQAEREVLQSRPELLQAWPTNIGCLRGLDTELSDGTRQPWPLQLQHRRPARSFSTIADRMAIHHLGSLINVGMDVVGLIIV